MENNLKSFKEAARIYTEKSTVSKESAKQTLIKEGILNEDGELTDNYKPLRKRNE